MVSTSKHRYFTSPVVPPPKKVGVELSQLKN